VDLEDSPNSWFESRVEGVFRSIFGSGVSCFMAFGCCSPTIHYIPNIDHYSSRLGDFSVDEACRRPFEILT